MGILSITHLRGGQRDIWWFEVLNEKTSVPWEVEIKYSTMEWFHYDNTVRYSLERWTKEYMMIWGFFCCFQAMKAPLMAPRVPNGSQWTHYCVLRSRDQIFYYGMISLWEYWAISHLRGGQRNIWWFEPFFALFRQWKAPSGPPRVLNGSQLSF